MWRSLRIRWCRRKKKSNWILCYLFCRNCRSKIFFVWWKNKFGFSVKIHYHILEYVFDSNMHVDDSIIQLLNKLWITNAPSKILIFDWRLLLNRLPTRFALANRRIISGNHNLVCPFYLIYYKSISYLFAECRKASWVCDKIFLWLDITCHTQVDVSNTYIIISSLKGRVNKKHRLLVWLAISWSIWISRNEMVFKGAYFRVGDLVNRAKSWLGTGS